MRNATTWKHDHQPAIISSSPISVSHLQRQLHYSLSRAVNRSFSRGSTWKDSWSEICGPFRAVSHHVRPARPRSTNRYATTAWLSKILIPSPPTSRPGTQPTKLPASVNWVATRLHSINPKIRAAATTPKTEAKVGGCGQHDMLPEIRFCHHHRPRPRRHEREAKVQTNSRTTNTVLDGTQPLLEIKLVPTSDSMTMIRLLACSHLSENMNTLP